MSKLEYTAHGDLFTVMETALTRRSQLLLLCARIGYSPPVLSV